MSGPEKLAGGRSQPDLSGCLSLCARVLYRHRCTRYDVDTALLRSCYVGLPAVPDPDTRFALRSSTVAGSAPSLYFLRSLNR